MAILPLPLALAASDEDDLHAQGAEDATVRFRTEAVLKALASDLEEVRAIDVDEHGLDSWRAERKARLEALTAELNDELLQHRPDALVAETIGEDDSEAMTFSHPLPIADAEVTGSVPNSSVEPLETSSGREDVMAELARREATRAELLRTLM
ncbi:hypothetical protein T492DRAFT_936395, partial [Pavlovales sp. CCMP2436]